MTDDPTARNRLDEEESPYLRQHADNPVNWQPWDQQALAAAKDRDVPIFLSIGYAACHWCHVMEAESFQDEEVARRLNEQFVPVKVDREERPDVDSIYMSICQQVTGRGGWPLNAWLTPEGEPFYVGTYFPKEPRRNAPGFAQLLDDIADSWADPEEREEMERRARQWTDAIEGDLEETPDQPGKAPDETVLVEAADAALRGADREFGGWGRGQKFPQSGRLRVLTRAFDREGRDTYRQVVTEALDAMADGGMYDHLGGGFHRYTTDREWVVPHFEKMLYDNAELPRTYLAGYQLTGTERYREVAAETLAFVERELTHPEGGFYSTLDAESLPPGADDTGDDAGSHSPGGDDTGGDPEPGSGSGDAAAGGHGEEGAFYVWTRASVREAVETHADVDADLATDLFCDRYGVTPSGNFEGKTVLTLSASVDALAEEYDRDPDEVGRLLAAAEEAALKARETRPRPARDEKVLAGWNGLMVSAFAEAAVVDDPAWAETASAALSFVREHLWDDDEGRLARRYKDGDVRIQGYLEDYAFLARGALNLYESTGDVGALSFALDLAAVVEEEFWDEDERTLYFTPESGESLVARPQELADRSTPSSAGVAAETLLALSGFVAHDRFETVAAGVVETHGGRIESDPVQHPSLVLAADVLAHGHSELTVAGGRPTEWRERLAETYVPRRLLAPRPGTDEELAGWVDRLGLAETPPVWAGREARDGEPTVYACQERACSPPRHDLAEALEWFDG
ncbi:thioredoxin domain-containing protein [Halobacteriales archaeon QS_4_69_31]|nr:MAG: thioredoxin domain-containing protein [Halobacteriales archaeon QS_4_69_31]